MPHLLPACARTARSPRLRRAQAPEPYQSDLSARTNATAFKRLAGNDITAKANIVRKVGNIAVHEDRPINEHTALNTLRTLHHLVIWVSYHHGTAPDSVPTSAAYDPSLIPAPKAPGSQPPLSETELNDLLKTFDAKDKALEAARAANDQLQTELTEMRAKVAAAQAAKTQTVDEHDYDEASTRTELIDLYLGEAGWTLTEQRDREYPLTGLPTPSGDGFADYVLWGDNGLPLGVIEAKRTTKDPSVGQQQAKFYADALEQATGQRPVIFMTNGYRHQVWDDAAGYPPRDVSGFFTSDELALMIRRRTQRLDLNSHPIDKSIVERHYQLRAIKAVDRDFTQKHCEALLVMATGSGKTRTTIALVDQLMKAGWVKRTLFLADRTALVRQARNAFTKHLPDVQVVNLLNEKVGDGRVYVSTYPTMMGLIDSAKEGVRRFGPGFFDLIVIDEAHRSVYQKYRHIFEYFDAMLVGLTATPKDEIDRNTYGLFHLEDGVPTDAYPLDDAVAEGYLVPPVGVSVPLKFLREGIRYDDLSDDEKDEWDSREWGDDGVIPDFVDSDKLNRWLFNQDTVDKVLQTLMERGHKVAGGDRIGKTIIFAKNQDHARFIQERFDANYPWLGGTHAAVITHATDYANTLIDDFATADKAPHIAISVDMLDTGIDVPEVVNLVFFKLVRSKSKFWQMIGRGTRKCDDLFGPGEHKKDFYVFGFCQNLEYFSQPDAGSEGSTQKSLAQRLFEARLGLLAALDASPAAYDGDTDGTQSIGGLRRDVATSLRDVVAGMDVANFIVRPKREWVETYAAEPAWGRVSPELAGELAQHLAGLPSAVAAADADEQAKRFDLLMLRIQLAQLESDVLMGDRLRRQVQEIADALLGVTGAPAVAAQAELLEQLAGDDWWVDVTLPMLELARRRVRSLVALIDKAKRAVVYTNFKDELGEGSIVELPNVNVGTNWDRFVKKSRAYLRDHEDHVAVQRLRRNLQLTDTDLSALEQMLLEAGARAEQLARASEESQGLGLFVRSLVGLDRAAAADAFADFLHHDHYTVEQIRFVDLIVKELTVNGVVEARRIFTAPPFTDEGPQGAASLFPDGDVERIVTTLNDVRARALVGSSSGAA